MSNNEITFDDVTQAYQKFKSSIYYDTSNTNIFLRERLALFEVDQNSVMFEDALDRIERQLNNLYVAINGQDNKFFSSLIKNISFHCLPKNINPDNEYASNIIVNNRTSKNYFIDKVTYFIDAPIELHILSVLWLMKIGYKLDAVLGENCYGNRLSLVDNEKRIKDGLSLFIPYHNQYKKWRDDALDLAKSDLTKNHNIAILNLDIKDYYNSVRIKVNDINSLTKSRSDGIKYINKIFIEIHERYRNIFTQRNIIEPTSISVKELILPIGFPSSSVLANWYLSSFDSEIEYSNDISYYGRYVDDILIVLRVTSFKKIQEQNNPFRFIIENYFSNLFDYPDKNNSDDTIRLIDFKNLFIQQNKVFLYLFDHRESISTLDKLKEDMLERSSEYRDFPTEDYADKFDKLAYELIYSDSFAKPRTLKDYKENRYGLTLYLTKRIFMELNEESKTDEDINKLIRFFKGYNALEFYRLWEKVFTLLIVKNDIKSLTRFYNNCVDLILNTEISEESKALNKVNIKIELIKYFKISFELSLALNPVLLWELNSKIKNINEKIYDVLSFELEKNKIDFENYYHHFYRGSNLIRHHYVSFSLLNYTNLANDDPNLSLVTKKFPFLNSLPDILDGILLKINKVFELYSPRQIKFYEACLLAFYESINTESLQLKIDKLDYVNVNPIVTFDDEEDAHLLERAFDIYYSINFSSYIHKPDKDDLRDKIYKRKLFRKSRVKRNRISIPNAPSPIEKLKIAVASMQVNDNDILNNIKGRQRLKGRDKVYSKLINYVMDMDDPADLFILPEHSVIDLSILKFGYFSSHSQIGVVFGLEHLFVNKIAFNFIITILPFEVNGNKDAVIIPRLKNHYSPFEEDLLIGNHYKIPIPDPAIYDHFIWRGLYFSNYYCYELADISHRSLFKSKVDFLIASEWNKDINYFSNVIESVTRDIHCYFIQVNTAQFGDSRITSPQKTEIMDLLRLKGGINETILVGEIDIKSLRDFQYVKYSLQKDDRIFSGNKKYKPIPPSYIKDNVKKRINNELF